MNKKRLI